MPGGILRPGTVIPGMTEAGKECDRGAGILPPGMVVTGTAEAGNQYDRGAQGATAGGGGPTAGACRATLGRQSGAPPRGAVRRGRRRGGRSSCASLTPRGVAGRATSAKTGTLRRTSAGAFWSPSGGSPAAGAGSASAPIVSSYTRTSGEALEGVFSFRDDCGAQAPLREMLLDGACSDGRGPHLAGRCLLAAYD